MLWTGNGWILWVCGVTSIWCTSLGAFPTPLQLFPPLQLLRIPLHPGKDTESIWGSCWKREKLGDLEQEMEVCSTVLLGSNAVPSANPGRSSIVQGPSHLLLASLFSAASPSLFYQTSLVDDKTWAIGAGSLQNAMHPPFMSHAGFDKGINGLCFPHTDKLVWSSLLTPKHSPISPLIYGYPLAFLIIFI